MPNTARLRTICAVKHGASLPGAAVAAAMKSVIDGGESPVSLADGRAPVVIAAAAAESARTGASVEV